MNDVQISATVAALLVGLGGFLKHQTPLRNDWIPTVLMIVAVGATLGLTNGWAELSAWIQAVMAGFTAVGVHSSTVATKNGIAAATIKADPEQPTTTGTA